MRFRSATKNCFNPLPPPKRGETCFSICRPRQRITEGFQSTPPAEAKGDFPWLSFVPTVAVRSVSIHSPRRSEGRLHSSPSEGIRIALKFQSTPPAEARGDDAENAS